VGKIAEEVTKRILIVSQHNVCAPALTQNHLALFKRPRKIIAQHNWVKLCEIQIQLSRWSYFGTQDSGSAGFAEPSWSSEYGRSGLSATRSCAEQIEASLNSS